MEYTISPLQVVNRRILRLQAFPKCSVISGQSTWHSPRGRAFTTASNSSPGFYEIINIYEIYAGVHGVILNLKPIDRTIKI